jgi:hypothetical protein
LRRTLLRRRALKTTVLLNQVDLTIGEVSASVTVTETTEALNFQLTSRQDGTTESVARLVVRDDLGRVKVTTTVAGDGTNQVSVDEIGGDLIVVVECFSGSCQVDVSKIEPTGGTVSSDVVAFPETTIDGTVGLVTIGDVPFLHGRATTLNSFGGGAGTFDATGTQNTGFGFNTLESLTSGRFNCAWGRAALRNLTEGDGNMAIGIEAMEDMVGGVGGSDNVAIGRRTLQLGTQVNQAVAIGNFALQDAGPGAALAEENVAIGYRALRTVTTGEDNTAIGSRAGDNTLTTGSRNTLIGKDANVGAASISDSIAIGHGAVVAASSTCLLGGTGANAVKIASGKATASVKLDLEEDETITGDGVDDASSGIALAPKYNADDAATFTIDRHNYLELKQVVAANAGAGGLVVTDAAVMRFDADAGTHLAVDSGTTKTSPGTVDAWVKVNINGTIYFLPGYTSKTT